METAGLPTRNSLDYDISSYGALHTCTCPNPPRARTSKIGVQDWLQEELAKVIISKYSKRNMYVSGV